MSGSGIMTKGVILKRRDTLPPQMREKYKEFILEAFMNRDEKKLKTIQMCLQDFMK